jgi:hypothetical protein
MIFCEWERGGAWTLQNVHGVQFGAAACYRGIANLQRRQELSKYLPG